MEGQDIETAKLLANHEQRIVGVEHRVKDLEAMQQSMSDLIRSVDKLAYNMEGMLNEQKEQGERLKKLEGEPAEQWSSMKKTAFTTIVSVIAGALASGAIILIAQNF